MRLQEKIFCWNCRDARSIEFLREMKEFGKIHRSAIIILVEPKISESTADDVCKKLGQSCWVQSDADGFSGGIWCLWDEDEMVVELRYAHTYFLHLAVASAGGKRWEVTAVYAPPNTSRRRSFWERMDEVKTKNPWLIIGDFNCVLHDEE